MKKLTKSDFCFQNSVPHFDYKLLLVVIQFSPLLLYMFLVFLARELIQLLECYYGRKRANYFVESGFIKEKR